MKSWADNSSSDEDSDTDIKQNAVADLSGLLNTVSIDTDLSYDNTTVGVQSPVDIDADLDFPPVPPPVDFGHVPENAPNRPPYTAHIGNLSFGVKEKEELANEIEKLVTERYNGDESVSVTEARIGVDRDTGKRRGYGYVEFNTLEELLILLNLNDGHSVVSGRMIRIDVAQPRRDRPPMRSDSRSRHRGGSFNDNDGHRGPRSTSRNRGQSNFSQEIDGKQFRGGVRRTTSAPFSAADDDNAGNVPKRPTLKLAPRSKPLMGAVTTGLSNIFGGAKPREENVRSRQQQKSDKTGAVADTDRGNIKGKDVKAPVKGAIEPRSNGGRAGRIVGGGRGGRKGGRGRGDVSGRGRGDVSGRGRGDAPNRARVESTGDASGQVKTDASSHGTGDTSGRGKGGGRASKRGAARGRTTSEGSNAWNKRPISTSKITTPQTPPNEVIIPSEKSVTKVTNPFAAFIDIDSDSD